MFVCFAIISEWSCHTVMPVIWLKLWVLCMKRKLRWHGIYALGVKIFWHIIAVNLTSMWVFMFKMRVHRCECVLSRVLKCIWGNWSDGQTERTYHLVWFLSLLFLSLFVDVLALIAFPTIVEVHKQRGGESTKGGVKKKREKKREHVRTVMLISCYYTPHPRDFELLLWIGLINKCK